MIGTARIFVNENYLTLTGYLGVNKREMTISGVWAHCPSDDDVEAWSGFEQAVFADILRRLRTADGARLN